jgi:hypothetical protein
MQKSAQNRCSFTQNFWIRPKCPRIPVFPGLSGFPETLIYAIGRRISAQIGLGYLKMKRRGVLGGRDPGVKEKKSSGERLKRNPQILL